MKNTLLILFILFFQNFAFAEKFPQTVNYYESASAFGYCSGADFTFCSQDIENRSQNVATYKATNDCMARNGKPEAYSAHCNSNCYPFFMPANAPFQSVSCNSNCELSCQIAE